MKVKLIYVTANRCDKGTLPLLNDCEGKRGVSLSSDMSRVMDQRGFLGENCVLPSVESLSDHLGLAKPPLLPLVDPDNVTAMTT